MDALIALYPQIKLLHIVTVYTSGTLFFLRGSFLQLGATWPMAPQVRYLTYTVDTVLLAAAIALTAILHQYPFVHGWLTMKVVLLIVYIGLGTIALKRGRTRARRFWFWIAAMGVFLFMVSVARVHHPLGIFVRWLA